MHRTTAGSFRENQADITILLIAAFHF